MGRSQALRPPGAAYACEDERVFNAVFQRLVQPRLHDLEMASFDSLKRLISCHGRGRVAFYDGFVAIAQMRHRTREVADRLSKFAADNSGGRVDNSNPESQTVFDELFGKISSMVNGESSSSSLPSSSVLINAIKSAVQDPLFENAIGSFVTKVLLPPGTSVLTNAVMGQALSGLKNRLSLASQSAPAATTTTFGLMPTELDLVTAANVTEHVEMYYEVRA